MQAQTAEYIAQHLAELKAIARGCDLAVLAYLIEMAEAEASDQARRGTDEQPSE